jgi:hypothetical protein
VWLDADAMDNPPLVAYPQRQTVVRPTKMPFPAMLKKCESGNILILGCDNDISWCQFYESGQEVSSHDHVSFGTHDKSGVNILSPDVSTGEGLYDNILVINGFEMSTDPLKKLAEYIRLLKPSGSLYLQTSNMKSPLSFLFNQYWYGLNAPRNKILFNRKALKNVLSRSGFIDVKVTTDIAHTHEYTWHSINIVRNKWTSSYFAVPSNRGFMVILKWCVRIVDFISGGCGEELIGIARKLP